MINLLKALSSEIEKTSFYAAEHHDGGAEALNFVYLIISSYFPRFRMKFVNKLVKSIGIEPNEKKSE